MLLLNGQRDIVRDPPATVHYRYIVVRLLLEHVKLKDILYQYNRLLLSVLSSDTRQIRKSCLNTVVCSQFFVSNRCSVTTNFARIQQRSMPDVLRRIVRENKWCPPQEKD